MSAGTPRLLAEWLREAWADPAAGCPPPEAWLAEEQRALTGEERSRLQAHLAGCPACQAERELAAAFDGEAVASSEDVEWVVARLRSGPARRALAEGGPGNAPPAPVVSLLERRRARSAAWVRLAAAAALVLGLGVAFQTLQQPAPPAPPGAGVLRGGSIELVAPRGEVGEFPGELRWEAAEGAREYRIRIETAAGDALWQGEVEPASGDMTARMDLPEEARARMRRAVTYRWTVQALDADGRVVAESEPAEFRAAPEPEPPAHSTHAQDGDPQP